MMISSEAAPWAKSGGLADVVGALPGALTALGYAVSIVIPRYQKAPAAPSRRIAERIPIELGGGNRSVDIWQVLPEAAPPGVKVYFVDDPACMGETDSMAISTASSATTICASLCFRKRRSSRQAFFAHRYFSLPRLAGRLCCRSI